MMTKEEYEVFIEEIKELMVGRKIIGIEPVFHGEDICKFILQDDEGNITTLKLSGNDCGCWYEVDEGQSVLSYLSHALIGSGLLI
jgi:hypothetical protein